MKTFNMILLVSMVMLFTACGGGSSSDSTPTEDTTPSENIIIPDDTTPDDITAPVITIIGNNPETVIQDGTYTDASATALDDRDGTVTVITTGSVNTASVGSYSIIYIATDNAGNEARETRIVNVTATTVDNNLTLDDFEDVVPHDSSFESLHFSGSQNCAQCHDGISDTNGTDVSIVKAWKGTMMGNAAIDPLYLAKVASEVKRNPEFKDIIEAKCSRCHMPMAHVEAGFSGDATAMFGDGFLNPENPHYNAAKDSVSCTLCHQIEDTPQLGTDEGFSGKFVVAENFGTDRVSYGPYTNPSAQPMINNVQFTPKESSHIQQSKLCASCHNLDTPVINTQGSLNGATFPEQAVYTEWEYSEFNATKSCQECHMPQAEGSVVISTRGGNLNARSPFRQHQFIGANTYMLEILKNNRIKLGAVADTAIFEESISNTRDFLKAAADVTISSKSVTNGILNFSVLVRNHSGHKFPTSLPSRRAWLHVKVSNAAKQIVFESGAMNSEGQIIGVDDNTDGYEEHYEKIVDASEVQVYEPIMGDTDGKLTYTFMQASRYLKDNRILPLGFNKSSAPANAQPYGKAVDDNDFVGGSDTVAYEVSNLADDDYTISVTLHYQTASYGFMQDLYSDINLTEVALMKVLDDNTMNHFETISTDTTSVTIP